MAAGATPHSKNRRYAVCALVDSLLSLAEHTLDDVNQDEKQAIPEYLELVSELN